MTRNNTRPRGPQIKTKQVRESRAIETIRTILKSGRRLVNVKYNGQPSCEPYVMISYVEPKELSL